MNDERALIEQAQRGDQEAFLTLLSRYDRQIMSVVYRFTHDLYDREDLYQDIFMNCYRSIRKFQFRSSILTWLYRIALNRCLTYVRRKRPTEELKEHPAPATDWDRREKHQNAWQQVDCISRSWFRDSCVCCPLWSQHLQFLSELVRIRH